MGNRRMGLGRMEKLLETVDRDLDLTNSTLTNPTITNAVTLSTTGAASLATVEPMSAGAAITTGTGTVIKYGVLRVGKIITTQIFIDLTGLSSGNGADDIIGKAGQTGCSIGQITTAVNGTVTAGTIQCLEVPAGGDPDIDLYYADNNAGVEDAAASTLTSPVKLINSGDLTLGNHTGFIVDVVLPANKFLYLVCGDATDAAYTKGKILITLYGTV